MKNLDLNEINIILSETLRKVIDKEISLKQASMISKIAYTLSKNIVNTELKERVEFLEQALKARR
jgi:hypothetical protein